MLRLDALVKEEKKVPEKATKKRKKLLINQCLPCPGSGGFQENLRNCRRSNIGTIYSQKLVHQFWKGACVVMDNAKFDQGEMVRKSLEQAWAKLSYYLPILLSFSRGFFWWKLKAIFKNFKARTCKKLVDGITEARSKN